MRFRSLDSKNFQIYTAGNFFAMNGIWINRVIIGWLGWELTGLASVVGLLSFLIFAPTVIASPFFGVIIDRVNLKKFAIITQSIIASTAFLLLLFSYFNLLTIFNLCLIALVIGITTSADRSTRMTLVPRIVEKDNIANAIAVHGINFNSARLIGPALGGILIDSIGFNLTIFINFLFFLCMPVALILVNVRRREGRTHKKKNIFYEFLDGAKFAYNQPVILKACILTALFSFCVRGAIEILPAIAGGIYNQSAQGLGQMLAGAGAGALVAALYIASQRSNDPEKGIPLRVYVSSIFGFLALILLGYSNLLVIPYIDSWYFALFAVFMIGFSMTINGIDLQAVVQLELDDVFRGRVMSLWVVLVIGIAAFSAILMGLFADLVGIGTTLMFFSVLGFILFTMMLVFDNKKN